MKRISHHSSESTSSQNMSTSTLDDNNLDIEEFNESTVINQHFELDKACQVDIYNENDESQIFLKQTFSCNTYAYYGSSTCDAQIQTEIIVPEKLMCVISAVKKHLKIKSVVLLKKPLGIWLLDQMSMISIEVSLVLCQLNVNKNY